MLYSNINILVRHLFTFDHRTLRARLPVRSALFKQRTGGLVVRWVTTSEYPLLNVFDSFFVHTTAAAMANLFVFARTVPTGRCDCAGESECDFEEGYVPLRTTQQETR
jgi:hypothetical protein